MVSSALRKVRQVMIEKIFISQLQDKQSVQTLFMAKNKALLKDKKGKSYVSCLLSDSTGDVDAKAWDNVEQIEGLFQSGDIISVKGTVQLYQNRKQVIIHKIERYEGDVDLKDYIQASKVRPEDLHLELVKIVETVESTALKTLILGVLSDPTIKPLLLIAPAAKSVHHARFGGLLEHIVSIVKLSGLVCQNYPQLNRDLLIFGAIFHDIGKIWELKIDEGGIRYTDRGRLIGHMVMACELVDRKTQSIFNFPQELKDICKHMILSHHGKMEYGSPKLPQTLEAYVLWMLDEMDSKIDSIQAAMSLTQGEEPWSLYSQLFERNFYLKGNKWSE
jgi:3'-5' exoribonuclease